MGLIGWLFGSNNSDSSGDHSEEKPSWWSDEDTEEDNNWIGPLAARRDREIAAATNDYEEGQAGARFTIDDMRRYYHQYRFSSFQEALQKTGEYWDHMVESEQDLVSQGYTERQGHLDFARGQRSMYD